MKRTLLLMIIAGLFFGGCTSKEQDEKIHAFWQEQAFKLMSHPAFAQAMMKMAMRRQAAAMPGFAGQEMAIDEQELQKMMEELQALQAQGFDANAFNDPNLLQDTTAGKAKTKRAAQPEQKSKTAVLITPSAQKANKQANPQLMQLLEAVKESNARTIQEYRSITSEEQQKRISQVMAETEKDLQDLISKGTDMETFLNAQMNLMMEQERKINQIIMEDLGEPVE